LYKGLCKVEVSLNTYGLKMNAQLNEWQIETDSRLDKMESQLSDIEEYHTKMDKFVGDCERNFETLNISVGEMTLTVSANTETNIKIHATVKTIGWVIAFCSGCAAIASFFILVTG